MSTCRSGPPGADYNTLPPLKPRARQLVAFHWREDDAEYLEAFADGWRGALASDRLSQRFHDAWRCQVRALALACR